MTQIGLFFMCAIAALSSARKIDNYLPTEINVRPFYSLNNQLKLRLEKLRDTLKEGDPQNGIPRLDPLDVSNYTLNLDRNETTVKLDVKDLHMDGLAGYEVKKANMSTPLLKHNITVGMFWPVIEGKTDYILHAWVNQKLPIYGNGHINFTIQDFYFETNAKLMQAIINGTRKYQIENVYETKITVNKTKINITGLYDDDELSAFVSEVISDMLPDALAEYQEEVTKEVNKYLIEALNEFLKTFDLLGR